MPIVNRPTRTIKWAESGNQAEPSTEKQELGWVIEKPPNEIMNWIHNQQDTATQYLLQEAGVEWFVEQPYSATSQVTYNGTRYKSKIANVGKQPDLFPDVWDIAYSDYSLTTEFNQVLNTDNYAYKLVYKDAPIFRAKAIGTSYQANTGTTEASGYSFKSFTTDGLFHNTSPVMLKNGLEVARFEPVTSMNESNKKVVTMDVLQKYLQQYKVGDLYLTTNRSDPSQTLGYGVWERYAEGKAIVGFSSSTSNSVPEWVKNGGGEFGEYKTVLQEENTPPHRHYSLSTRGGSTDISITNSTMVTAWRNQQDYNGYIIGGNTEVADIGETSNPLNKVVEGHNNVQPSIVVFVWKRIS